MSQQTEIGSTQLKAWERLAGNWPTYNIAHPVEGDHQRCMECHVSVYRVADDNGKPYVYSEAEILALTVAHLRQCHQNLESVVYQEAGQSWLV